MPLKMRPTGLGHGVYKDVPDYGIYCGEWCIGRIYETRTVSVGSGRSMLRANRNVSHRQPSAYAGTGQGRVRGELEAVEGVGGGGRTGSRATVVQGARHRPRGPRGCEPECSAPGMVNGLGGEAYRDRIPDQAPANRAFVAPRA
jgi:hypothetical protein